MNHSDLNSNKSLVKFSIRYSCCNNQIFDRFFIKTFEYLDTDFRYDKIVKFILL